MPAEVKKQNLQPVGRLPATSRLRLAIELPLRKKEALTRLLEQLYNPTSMNYCRYLTPEQFTKMFGPTEQDYQVVIGFAEASGLTVTARHPNRVVLDVEGAVRDIESAFHLALRVYPHPTEARTFYAPDVEPSSDLAVPIVHISGLNNYSLPHPAHGVKPLDKGGVRPNSGSGPGGWYQGSDFRAAYVPGTTLSGTGQSVGLLQFDGYYESDIAKYEKAAGLTNAPLTNVPIDGGVTTPGGGNSEVCLDIEMVISMAPGISMVYVYEAPEGSPWVDLLNRMANDNLAKQLSCSWGGGEAPANSEGIFQQMASQGQSFFCSSGDGDAFVTPNNPIPFPEDSPYITLVGGTTLTTTGPAGGYVSESVWNWGLYNGQYWGSSGGISPNYAIPTWQQGISMAANQGSTTMRNIPDVALTADQIYIVCYNGVGTSSGGTSAAAPLWAGFTALVNQQAAASGQPSVGFLNPTLYQIAKGPLYSTCFHDITSGSNTWSASPTEFYAVAGYDLCTGLGTPNGTNLINALMPYSGAVWVDFNYTGTTENGSYNAPYKTLVQGVNAVSASGNIWIKTAGSSHETMTISKPRTIRVYGGPATIGQ